MSVSSTSVQFCCGGKWLPNNQCSNGTLENAQAQIWTHSLQVVIPASCPPGSALRLEVAPNAYFYFSTNHPDVWWAVSEQPTTVSYASNNDTRANVATGTALRVFGRSIGWNSSLADSSCIAGSLPPQSNVSARDVSGTRTHCLQQFRVCIKFRVR